MGGGIAAMHYTGMAALKMSPSISYEPTLFTLSLLIAFLASFFALKLCFQAGAQQSDLNSLFSRERLLASLVMGLAIAGMHYTGMVAARFDQGAICQALDGGISSGTLSILIVLGVVAILLFTLMLLVLDLKLAHKDRQLVTTLQQHNIELREQAEQLAQQMLVEVRASGRKDRLLAAIVEQSTEAIVTLDLDNCITSWNRAAERMFGLSHDEVAGRDFDGWVMEGCCDCPESGRDANPDVPDYLCECHVGGGHRLEVQISRTPLRDEERQRVGSVLVIDDVTEQRQVDQQLRLMAQVFENSGEGIMITDRDNRILSVNRAFSQITGYSADEVIGQDPELLSSGHQSDEFYRTMWQAIDRQGSWRGELWNRNKSGELYPQLLTVSVIKNGLGEVTHYIGIITDISEQKEYEAQIRYLADHDSLTGLPNRNLLNDRMAQAFKNAARHQHKVGAVFIDLDRFKSINDTHGHEAGDRLLKEVALRLSSAVRDSDTVCRLGGDEFLILLPELQQSRDIVPIVENLFQLLSADYPFGAQRLSCSPSIGVCLYPDDGDDPDSIISHADTAMYHAKDEGRGNIQFYTDKLNRVITERMAIEKALKGALARGEFSLCFQPQIALDSGEVIGVEALLRWQSASLGPVAPDRFIPIAEETGHIDEIGAWVLAQAAAAQRQIEQATGLSLQMAVNISVKQVAREGFVERCVALLEQSGVDLSKIELELTETALMESIERAAEALKQLNKMGLMLAIDDFGSGYSSLNYLRRLPIDKLKIDRSFVTELPHNDEDCEIAQAIIGVGHGLGMTVIAEGVEELAQADYLLRVGCDQVQGYYYSRPLPFESLCVFLNQRFNNAG